MTQQTIASTPSIAPAVTADVLDQFTRAFPSVDEQRLTKAVALVQGGHCERLATLGLWLVRSASRANLAHQVDAASCSCEDYQKRGGMCIHRSARSLYLLAERAAVDAEAALDADAPISLELSGAGYLALVTFGGEWFEPSEEDDAGDPDPDYDGGEYPDLPPAPPAAFVPTITRLPMSPELQAISDELFGPEVA